MDACRFCLYFFGVFSELKPCSRKLMNPLQAIVTVWPAAVNDSLLSPHFIFLSANGCENGTAHRGDTNESNNQSPLTTPTFPTSPYLPLSSFHFRIPTWHLTANTCTSPPPLITLRSFSAVSPTLLSHHVASPPSYHLHCPGVTVVMQVTAQSDGWYAIAFRVAVSPVSIDSIASYTVDKKLRLG